MSGFTWNHHCAPNMLSLSASPADKCGKHCNCWSDGQKQKYSWSFRKELVFPSCFPCLSSSCNLDVVTDLQPLFWNLRSTTAPWRCLLVLWKGLGPQTCSDVGGHSPVCALCSCYHKNMCSLYCATCTRMQCGAMWDCDHQVYRWEDGNGQVFICTVSCLARGTAAPVLCVTSAGCPGSFSLLVIFSRS